MKIIFWVTTALVLAACTSQVRRMEGSSRVPGALGMVRLEETKNKNTAVTLQVEHLAPPEKLAQGLSTYVVWAQPTVGDARPYNLGALRVGKDLKGDLDTVVPYRTFNLFITAEPTASVTNPSGDTLLWTQIGQMAE